jgi:dTMP kinase
MLEKQLEPETLKSGIKHTGLFITFEGMEGSGKSTLISNLTALLQSRGIEPVVTREPGGTSLGGELRKILLDPAGSELCSMGELFLYAADRAQHIEEVIKPALAENRTVLCDRFSDATAAYQGYGRGVSLEVISVVDREARDGVTPDLTVLLDLPPEEGLKRVRSRNERSGSTTETRMDDEQPAFHRKVREGYLALSAREPDRFLILNAMARPDELASQVIQELERRFPNVF